MVRTRHGKLVRREQCKRGVPISMHGHLAVELGNISYGNVLSKHTTSSGQHPPHLPHSSIPSSSTPSPSTPSSSTPSSSTPSPLTPSSSTPSFSTDQRQVLRSSLRSVPLPHHTCTSSLHHTATLVLHHTTYPPLHPTFPPTVLPSSAPKVHDTCRTTIQSFSPTGHFPFHPFVQFPSTPSGQTPFALPVESSHDDVVQPTPATSKHHVLPEEVRRDASGRVIIRPVGKGWTPNRYAVEAIGHAIRSQFEGPYHHYEAMPEDAQLKWWTKFKVCEGSTLVTFHSRIRNKKNGGWVDGRASETYETYHERLRVIQAESFERSTSDPKQISAVIKIQCWKDVVGGKSKGRVYGTADLAANIRHGVSSLTQPSLLAAATDHIDHSAENEQLRQQVTQANITAREAMERCAKLEDTMQLLKQQMAMMMERQVGDRSTSTT